MNAGHGALLFSLSAAVAWPAQQYWSQERKTQSIPAQFKSVSKKS
jgi:hypothetical protein